MPLPNCPEEYVQCPYEEAHVIMRSRLQFHLVKCKKNHNLTRMVECPINSTHVIPEIELNCHRMYLCSDRKKLDTFICSTDEATPLFPVQEYRVSTSEDWDDVEVKNYDPMEHCKNMPVLLNLQGATPSDRKQFRAEERQRYRDVAGTAGPSNVKNTKDTTRLPQTTPVSFVDKKEETEECGQRKKNPDVPKKASPRGGRGRGRLLHN